MTPQTAKGKTVEEVFNDYDGFVEKFKPKKTTDDCETPENIYNAVADWVANEYHTDRADFVRPFYPGRDYTADSYEGKIVVDNPPFSILGKIITFYQERNIPFFLFAPTLTACKHSCKGCTFLASGAQLTYANDAKVSTSFVTNLEPYGVRLRTVPKLTAILEEENKKNEKASKKQFAKYRYPAEVVTGASLAYLSQHGIDLVVPRDQSTPIPASTLDLQREHKKTVFGGGYFVSREIGRQAKEARRQAEEARTIVWELSEKEQAIIDTLSAPKADFSYPERSGSDDEQPTETTRPQRHTAFTV